MSTLHLVRQSAFSRNDFEQCISVLAEQDSLVLMDDGCYNLKHPLMASLLKKDNNKVSIKVISTHAQARAVEVMAGISQITMADVVELTFNHNKVITWQ
ncbi:sulfurtransferase complex subunit TusB [Colwellia ponticola]|uniref:Sulfurtransferase complex subunit TusB n=1 Tax=Colwellia ponticola TaxID=2304625 RepID=A0A8H2JMT4_9GAMM|nr:sulfurtransferase complex subunit TusB [Colwellia ponticola]TMM43251.1 sulfurtransferase complex subunit TusB [Colwellia ponticola]